MDGSKLVVLLSAASLGACAATGSRDAGGDGPSGGGPIIAFVEPTETTLQRRFRIEDVTRTSPTRGVVNTLYLYADGTALSQSFRGDEAVRGRWERYGQDICFIWPVRGRECWPKATDVQSAQIVAIVSDRGVVARFTGY